MAVFLFLLITVCSVTSSFACFCMPEHPQKQFCNAGGFGHANVQNKSLTKLYTPSRISSCRVQLQPYTEYLLFGKILDGNLYTSFCNFHQKWTEVTPEQRAGVEMQYSQGCKCKIGFCFANCGGLLLGCDGFDPHWMCRAKYHRCYSYRDQNGVEKCGWRGRGQRLFQQCARRGYGFP
nr:metalloproteinase inhibitor 3-like isoform X2 [Pocillopora verrucosa]